MQLVPSLLLTPFPMPLRRPHQSPIRLLPLLLQRSLPLLWPLSPVQSLHQHPLKRILPLTMTPWNGRGRPMPA